MTNGWVGALGWTQGAVHLVADTLKRNPRWIAFGAQPEHAVEADPKLKKWHELYYVLKERHLLEAALGLLMLLGGK